MGLQLERKEIEEGISRSRASRNEKKERDGQTWANKKRGRKRREREAGKKKETDIRR